MLGSSRPLTLLERFVDAATFETRLAWRGVRARGWQAPLMCTLLGIALGTNTVLFSAADAFVFNRASYRSANRLGVIARQGRAAAVADQLRPAVIREWQRQTDLFDAVHAYLAVPGVHLSTNGVTEPLAVVAVSPGLFDMLGVSPRWGRALSAGDAVPGAPPVVLIAEDLAVRLFGSAAAAVGRPLPIRNQPVVAGVMRARFRFPTAAERIWLPLDIDAVGYTARNIARLRDGVSFERARRGVEARMTQVSSADMRFGSAPMTLTSLSASGPPRSARLFGALTAAGWLLLLIACANVASLELAVAIPRARVTAIHAALGARRATLGRRRFLEAAILLGLSVAAGLMVFAWGSRTLAAALPPLMANEITNALDLDRRAVLVMLGGAAVAWVATGLPVLIRTANRDPAAALRNDTRASTSSLAALRFGQLLVVGQIGATVLLTVGAVLYSRTYAARAALDKGFDSGRLAAVELVPAPDAPASTESLVDAGRAVLDAQAGVEAFARTSSLLPATTSGIAATLRIDGRPAGGSVKLTNYAVEPSYFATLGIPIVEGRLFDASESAASVVIDEAFARRYWGAANPVGSTFDLQGSGFNGVSLFTVVGVARAVRVEADRTDRDEPLHVIYYPIGGQRIARFAARLRQRDALPALAAALRERLPGVWVRAEWIDDRYARLEGDRRLAAGTATALSALATAITLLGVYAVISFLVSTRLREIGIRIALGAQPRHIRAVVVRSACATAGTGALIGAVAAFVLSSSIESQLYGVSPRDPATYASASAIVLFAAAAAAWVPTRRATGVNPAITLRRRD